jgi:hypothetical protein
MSLRKASVPRSLPSTNQRAVLQFRFPLLVCFRRRLITAPGVPQLGMLRLLLAAILCLAAQALIALVLSTIAGVPALAF